MHHLKNSYQRQPGDNFIVAQRRIIMGPECQVCKMLGLAVEGCQNGNNGLKGSKKVTCATVEL